MLYKKIQQLKNSNKAIKDTLSSLSANMWEIISGILSSVIIARGLGVEDLGKYALILV